MHERRPTQTADTHAAHQLALGRTLVAYWAYNRRGELAPFCKWVLLRPGESVAQAAERHSVTKPQPVWTPQLKTQVANMLQAIQGRRADD